MIKKINVLGTVYTIKRKAYKNEPYFDKNFCDGFCDGVEKEIVICDMSTYPGYENESKEFCLKKEKIILRHELTHAFFNESGLSCSSMITNNPWAKNEEMIDWIALQGVKLYKCWEACGCL